MAFKNTSMQYTRKMADAIISYNNGDLSGGDLTKKLMIYGVLNPIIYSASKAPWWVGKALLLGALGAWARGEAKKETDWEQIGKDQIASALVSLASSPFNAIPVIDDIAKAVATKAIKGKAPYQVMTLPLLSDLEMGIKKLLTKKNLTLMDYLETLGTAGEMSTGLPFDQMLGLGKDYQGEKTKKKLKIGG